MKKRIAVILTTMCLTASQASIAMAANMSDLELVNYTEDIASKMESSDVISKIPDEVFKYHKFVGGKVTFKPVVISPDGVKANGLYWATTDERDNIEISTSQDFMDESLAHEMGHFIYFNTSMSDEDKEILNNLHRKYAGYDPSATKIEETFAARYASYIYSDYYLTEDEKSMFKRCEEQIAERFNSGFIEALGPGQETLKQ